MTQSAAAPVTPILVTPITGLDHYKAIFTALYGMQTRSCDENSVCPSVRPSNAWIVTNRKKICLNFYTIRKIID